MSMFNKAVKPILSSFKGAKSGILGGAAMGGGAGAVYGGISDNHTALGMGVAGAIAGGFGGREYKAFKGYQGAMNKNLATKRAGRIGALQETINTKSMGGIDSSRELRAMRRMNKLKNHEGMSGLGSYVNQRMNSIFA